MDWRDIQYGLPIPTEPGYSDQPSVVETAAGSWLLCITTGKGGEGAAGQYLAVTRSDDQGKHWTAPVAIENPEWESAYGTLARAPGGRIFCFYCYNLHHVDCRRLGFRYDMGGAFVFRYTDDEGRTWSERREISVPLFASESDAPSVLDDKPLRFFWNASRPFFHKGKCYVPLTHYVPVGGDIVARSEGSLLCCNGLEENPDAPWRSFPEGNRHGILAPEGGGTVAEEQSHVMLSDDTIFCTFRTNDGRPACSLSRDGGKTFAPSRWMRYASGEMVKHCRAATFLWPVGEGRYLYWLHNATWRETIWRPRNPVWTCLAEEVDTPEGKDLIFHSPELFLYGPEPDMTISYPHLFQSRGRWYLAETDKVIARIHPLPDTYLNPGKQIPPPIWRAPNAMPQMLIQNSLTLLLRWQGRADGELFRLNDLCVELFDGKLHWHCADTDGVTKLGDGNRHAAALVLDGQARIGYAITDGCYRMNPLYERDYEWLPEHIEPVGGKPYLASCITEACAWNIAMSTAQMETLTAPNLRL